MKKKFTFCVITVITCLPMVFAVSSLIIETRKGVQQEKASCSTARGCEDSRKLETHSQLSVVESFCCEGIQ
jgi:hypothetical protein